MNDSGPEPMEVSKTTSNMNAGKSLPYQLQKYAMIGDSSTPSFSPETDFSTIARRSGIDLSSTKAKQGAVDIEACRLDVQRAAVTKLLSGNSKTIRQCLLHVGFEKEQASNRTMQMRVRRQVQKIMSDLQTKGGSGQSSQAAQILAQLQQNPVNAPQYSSKDMTPFSQSLHKQNASATPPSRRSRANIPFRQINMPLRKASSDEISVLTTDSPGANASKNNLMSSQTEPAHGSLGTSLEPQTNITPMNENRSDPSPSSNVSARASGKSHRRPPSLPRMSSIDSIPTIPWMADSFNGQESFTGFVFNGPSNVPSRPYQVPPSSPIQRRESSRSSRRSMQLGDDFECQSAKDLLRDLRGFVSDDQTASSNIKIFEG